MSTTASSVKQSQEAPLFLRAAQSELLKLAALSQSFNALDLTVPGRQVRSVPPGLDGPGRGFPGSPLSPPPCLEAAGFAQILGTSPSGVREPVRFQCTGARTSPMPPMSSPMSPLSRASPESPALAATSKPAAKTLKPFSMAPSMESSIRRDSQVQRRINQEIIAAAKAPKAEVPVKILGVAETKLDQMNGVNLSTAMHRLARACDGASQALNKLRRNPVVLRMLDIVEALAAHELQHHDNTMPANCCTILAWSCASLRIFRASAFDVLVRVAVLHLKECQPYEITNILWAMAELCRRHPQTGRELRPAIQELVEASASALQKQESLKLQVLISGLMSLTLFPTLDGLAHKMLLFRFVLDLASRHDELEEEANVTPVLVSFDTMRRQHAQIYREILAALGDRFPTFTERYMLGNKGSRTKPAKKAQIQK